MLSRGVLFRGVTYLQQLLVSEFPIDVSMRSPQQEGGDAVVTKRILNCFPARQTTLVVLLF